MSQAAHVYRHSRRGGGRFLGESQDLGQCTHDGDLAAAARLAGPLGLVVLKPPPELRLEGFTMSALWHERTQSDAAHRWVRALFVDVAKGC